MAAPLRAAIYQALQGHAPLTALVTGIYHQLPPGDSTYPFVTFHKQSGVPRWTFGGAPLQSDLWLVKGVDRGSSATRAEEIAQAIDVAMNDVDLTITGHEHLFTLRESDEAYAEEAGGQTVHHVGALYRVVSE